MDKSPSSPQACFSFDILSSVNGVIGPRLSAIVQEALIGAKEVTALAGTMRTK